MEKAFIEAQFPVSKVSKESYKERKAVQSQTLTGLGKWWGRKPLILVRATILGCLMPASNNPQRDKEIFLKLLSMDEKGLELRKEKKFSSSELYEIVTSNIKLAKYRSYFDVSSGNPRLEKDAPRDEIELAAFNTLGYDAKIAMSKRPEHVEIVDEQSWNEINHHLHTSAHSLPELVNQLSQRKYGHNVRVGDCFCGGGSIPFEAARIGCDTYASDLNPIAGLLTWADLYICGAKDPSEIIKFLSGTYARLKEYVEDLGVEVNERGDRAFGYLYCLETKCPECGWTIPMLPTMALGIRAGRYVAKLIENDGSYYVEVEGEVSAETLQKAQNECTIKNNSLVCPHCKKSTAIGALRHDVIGPNGNTTSALRQWTSPDYIPREDDIFQEKLLAVRYERPDGSRYYCKPSNKDLENERLISEIVKSKFRSWQEKGFIPTAAIESGEKTEEVKRTRGWNYWHQLFTPRQLLVLSKLVELVMQADTKEKCVAGILAINRVADYSTKLCRWDPNTDISKQTYYNQALNTLYNWGARSVWMLESIWMGSLNNYALCDSALVQLKDARNVNENCDFWVTDPPYADAVMYDQLSEFFLSWDKSLFEKTFPEWYTDSKRILAVRGDEHFSQTMIDIYSNLTQHMTDNGMQIVMFTHSDPAVWAQLALIMWKAGLTVTAAWNIATETDASGLKDGNYVKGTVLLVLRKQQGEEEAFLDELTADIKSEVKRQIESMQKLDDKEDPNFSDPDYVLAAYAASLKVLTSYKAIGEIDLDYELNLAINDPSRSEVVKLIERAKKIAYDFIIPTDFDNYLWRDLTPAERFYIKGLESEKHGSYQISTYQEYARGFGLTSYSQLMANEKANTARLKTPIEFAMRTVSDVAGFEDSILRIVLAAIHVAVKEDENPSMGLWHLKNTVPNYWERRDMLKQLLSYLMECKDIDTMLHWKTCGEMASHIYTLVDNDRV